MNPILHVKNVPLMDTSITNIQEITINPVNANTLGLNDRPEFLMNQADSYLWLTKSYFLVSGKIEEKGENNVMVAPTKTKLANAGILHLFSQAEIKINGITVEQVNNPGITCIPKILTTYDESQVRQLGSMGWDHNVMNADGTFHNVIIPFRVLFGLAEDFRAVLINANVHVILTRARTNANGVITTGEEGNYTLTLTNIQVKEHLISVDDARRLEFLKIVEKDEPLPLFFRTWELHQHYDLPKSKKHTWTVRTVPQFEKPRFALLFFQTKRSEDSKKNASQFDHCNIRDVKLKLNSQSYPYENLDQDFALKNFSLFYNNYSHMFSTFTNLPDGGCLVSMEDYKDKYPIIVIDCSRQQETLKYGPVDVRVEIEANVAIPEGTTAYAILIHDTVYQYHPLTNVTKKYEG